MFRPSKRSVIIGVTAAAVAAAAPALALTSRTTTAIAPTARIDTVSDSATVRHLTLQSMPSGSVELTPATDGRIVARVGAYGLTPGSTHTVEVETPYSRDVIDFGTITADATGQAHATLTAHHWGGLPHESEVVLLLGTRGQGSLAQEPIAHTSELSGWPYGHYYGFLGEDVTQHGSNLGFLGGHATLRYDAAAHTITVNVTAFGLTPGAHAAHIHLGTCRSQGGVAYMMMDFTADGHGTVWNETRTITGVKSGPPAQGWYLNLHLGTSNTILANNAPTVFFRPVLCANI
jgi:hypothetical protein